MIIRATIAVLATAVLLSSMTTTAQAGIYKCTIKGAVSGLDGKLKAALEHVVKHNNPLIINTATGFVRKGRVRGTTWEVSQRGQERGIRRGWDWEFFRRLPSLTGTFEVIRLRLWPSEFDKEASGPRFSYYTGEEYFVGTCTEIS